MDIELLISMVRDRPVIWDKTCADYKNKDRCRDAWGEISEAFVPDYETMELVEQEILQTTLTKKWCNIKDSWLKWRRKSKEKKQVSNYCYSEQLKFLDINYDQIEASKEVCNAIQSPETSEMNNWLNVQPNLSVPDHPISPKVVPMEMDVELLICMIRDRPVLWDKTCAEYKSKERCHDAWVEICNALFTNFKRLKLEEQEALQTTLVKKWINIRDSWLKWRRKLDRKKEVKKYLHSEKLGFLNTIDNTHDSSTNDIQSQETLQINNSSMIQPNLSVPNSPSSSVLELSQSSSSPSVRVQSQSPSLSPVLVQSQSPPSPSVLVQSQSPPLSPVLVQSQSPPLSLVLVQSQSPPLPLEPVQPQSHHLPSVQEQQSHSSPTPVHLQTSLSVPPSAKRRAKNKGYTNRENENRHLSFFKSILPSMACFTDDETLEFQMGMLSTIQIIKKRRRLKRS